MINSQTFHHLLQLLIHIGFREKESLVYTTLLKMGPSVITNVARSIQLPRSSTYNLIMPLVKRGILKQHNLTYQQKYEAVHPNILLKYLYARRNKVDQQILSLSNTLKQLENRQ